MNTDDQLASLRNRIGEPVDPLQCRFTPTQLLDFLNASRRIVAEKTRCYPVKDTLTFTAAGTAATSITAPLPAIGQQFLISVSNDFIWCQEADYDNNPLRVVRAEHWSDVVGSDETLTGDPTICMFFGRQFQIYRVPSEPGGIFRYRGWAYPPVLVAGGVDAAFVDPVAEVAIWHCAMVVKGSDERSNQFETQMAMDGIAAIKQQYWPRGARYVNSGQLSTPRRPII